jgi:aminoglycoside 6'-N-acetyltransferase I
LECAHTLTGAIPQGRSGSSKAGLSKNGSEIGGVGGELMRSAEDWARAQGCLEMASDALIDNEESQRAHEALGFDVVDRCVHFRKGL